jgi:hypothetical protein
VAVLTLLQLSLRRRLRGARRLHPLPQAPQLQLLLLPGRL